MATVIISDPETITLFSIISGEGNLPVPTKSREVNSFGPILRISVFKALIKFNFNQRMYEVILEENFG